MKHHVLAVFSKAQTVFSIAFLVLLPTQLGKHFFVDFSYLSGVRVDYLAPTLYLTDILAVLIIAFSIPKMRLKKLFFVISGLFLVSLFFAASPLLGIYKSLKYLEIFLLFAAFTKISLSPKTLLLSFIAGASVEATLALLQFMNKGSIQGVFYFLGERYMTLSTPDIAKASINGREFLRSYGSFSHPNSMGGFYVLLYTFALIYRPFEKFIKLRALVLLLSSILLLMSFSKIAIGTFFIVSILYHTKAKLFKVCKLCFVSRVVGMLAVSGVFFLAHGDPLTIEKRVRLAENAFSIMWSHLIAGVGTGNYLLAQASYAMPYPFFFSQPVHNILLLFLSEQGVVLGSIILILMLYPTRKIWMQKKVLLLLGVVFLTGMFDHYWITLQQNMLLAPVILGLYLQQNRALKRRS